MKNVSQLFCIYIFLGIAYNLISLWLLEIRKRAAAPTDPLTGIMMMTLLYLLVATGPGISMWLYQFLLITLMALILRFGVIRHIWAEDRSAYYSELSRISAFSINGFGTVILLCLILDTMP